MFNRKVISDKKAKKILDELIAQLKNEVDMKKIQNIEQTKPVCLSAQNFFRTRRNHIIFGGVFASYVLTVIAVFYFLTEKENETKQQHSHTNVTNPEETLQNNIIKYGGISLNFVIIIIALITCFYQKSCLPDDLPPLAAPDNSIPANSITIAHPNRKLYDLNLTQDQKERLETVLRKIAEKIEAKNKIMISKDGIRKNNQSSATPFFDPTGKSPTLSVSLVNCIKLLEEFKTLMDSQKPEPTTIASCQTENQEKTSKPLPILTKTIKCYLEDFALAMRPKSPDTEKTPLNKVVIN